ncbi:MAG: hypothetical protein VKO39_13190 [Cyanobacteriota bacterium]|nr:hypothetical protein [Cyanobacteriota bacterium]
MTAARPDASLMPSAGASTVEAELVPLLEGVAQVAESHAGDPLALLTLLRQLEKLHRTIQDGSFRASLPSERTSLFRLLQDMEQSGGWPYIPRLQLRTFLDLLQSDEQPEPLESRPLGSQESSADQVPEAA